MALVGRWKVTYWVVRVHKAPSWESRARMAETLGNDIAWMNGRLA